ncbi:hypothetical protein [Salibacter sp.]
MSCQKITATGFEFKFKDVESALGDLF